MPLTRDQYYARALASVVKEEGGCWAWTRKIDADGYGVMSRAFGTSRAHRVVYERTVGPIAAGLDLDHLCRNRRCVNPDHLEPVTRAENNRRGIAARFGDICPHGHRYSDTAARNINGSRRCRPCEARRSREYQSRKRASLQESRA